MTAGKVSAAFRDPEAFVYAALENVMQPWDLEPIPMKMLVDGLEARGVLLVPTELLVAGERTSDIASQLIKVAETRIMELRARVAELEATM